jgi:predicted dehydrogenase
MSPTDRRSFLTRTAGLAGAFAFTPAFELARALPRQDAPIDVAVIGAGKQGRAILGELTKLEQVRVAAVCDTSPGRLRSGLRRVAGAEGYATHAELLEKQPGVKAVFVATPTHEHVQPCVDALSAGKHVFCEAPLASTLEDCRTIVKAARSAPGVFHTGMQGRSDPIYQLARSFVRSGAIRDVSSMRAQYHKKTSWRTPVSDPAEEKALNWVLDPEVTLGLVGEFGIQQFDVFHWFLEAYPTAVRGVGSIQLHEDGRAIPDTVSCELVFPGERVLTYDATLCNSFDGQYEQMYGEMGSVKLAWNAGWLFKEADAPTQGWEVYAIREQFHDEQGITLIADATKLAAQNKLKEGVGLPNPPLWYAISDFLRSVLEGAPVVCSAEEGLRAAAVGILAKQALESGEVVAIDESALKAE